MSFLFVYLFLNTEVLAQHEQSAIRFDSSRLVYFSDSENNRIPDYSHAGYRGGGVDLPNVPVKVEIGPVAGDNRAHIQNAINRVSKMRLDSNGHRGAVLLKPGNYWINGSLFIRESGVVLRGSGSGKDSSKNTTITVSRSVKGNVLQIGDERAAWFRSQENTITTVKTPYIPVGSRSFEVYNPEKFEIGDNIIFRLISTQQWIDSVNGGDTESGSAWQPGFLDMFYNRMITSKQDSIITMDAPVYNHVDTTLSKPLVYIPDRSFLVSESGVENLRIDIQTGGELTENHAENGVVFRGVENAWASDVTVLHFMMSGFSTHTSKNVTISNSNALTPHSKIEGSRRYNFNADPFSSQILFTNVTSSGGRRDFVSNGTSVTSGIVFHKSRSISTLNSSEGHQRWSQGLLFDSIVFENPQHYNVLSLHNRGDFGSSHGWGAAHSTAWNVEAGEQYIFIQKPPGAQNYGIGNRANVSGEGLFTQPEGHIELTGLHPFPSSLYDAQLAERLQFGVTPDIPLEFNLTNKQEDMIMISWKQLPPDETEISIERSEDGINFSEIARVPAVNRYYDDKDVIDSKFWYRIRSIKNGQHSAYTFPQSIVPAVSEVPISDFSLIEPLSDTRFTINDSTDETLTFLWEEPETNLELVYRWKLTEIKENGKVLAMVDSIKTTEITFFHSEINEILKDSGSEEEILEADWNVTAIAETFEKKAANDHKIEFKLASEPEPKPERQIPVDTSLDQNYPNPFNPLTTIEYHLAEDSQVGLAVYNISGVKVADLDRGFRERGTHSVTFEAGNFTSGVYFYRLQAGSAVLIRKMLLIK